MVECKREKGKQTFLRVVALKKERLESFTNYDKKVINSQEQKCKQGLNLLAIIDLILCNDCTLCP